MDPGSQPSEATTTKSEDTSLSKNTISSKIAKEFQVREELVAKIKKLGILFYPMLSMLNDNIQKMEGSPKLINSYRLHTLTIEYCRSERNGIKTNDVIKHFKNLGSDLKAMNEFLNSQLESETMKGYEVKTYAFMIKRLLPRIINITGDIDETPSGVDKRKTENTNKDPNKDITNTQNLRRVDLLNKILVDKETLTFTFERRRFRWSKTKSYDVEIRKTPFSDNAFRIKTNFLARIGENIITLDSKGNISQAWVSEMLKGEASDDNLGLSFERRNPFTGNSGGEMGRRGTILHSIMANSILEILLKKAEENFSKSS